MSVSELKTLMKNKNFEILSYKGVDFNNDLIQDYIVITKRKSDTNTSTKTIYLLLVNGKTKHTIAAYEEKNVSSIDSLKTYVQNGFTHFTVNITRNSKSNLYRYVIKNNLIQTENSDVQIKVTYGGTSYDGRSYSVIVTAKNSSGTVLWTRTYNNLPLTELGGHSDPYIQGNRLYMVMDGTLTCFDLYTGDILWTLNDCGYGNEIAFINDHQLAVSGYYGPHLTIVTYQNDQLISSSTYNYSDYQWPAHLKVVNGNIQLDMRILEPDCEGTVQLTIDLKGNIIQKNILEISYW